VEICKDGVKSENLPVVENGGEKYFEGLGRTVTDLETLSSVGHINKSK